MKTVDVRTEDRRPAQRRTALDLKKEQFNLRFQEGHRPAREDLARASCRRDIARIKTIAAEEAHRSRRLEVGEPDA